MAPLKVSILRPPSGKLDLIIPFDDSLTFAQLIEAASDRAARYTTNPTVLRSENCELRLNVENGFLVDHGDVVKDVLSSGDVIFIRPLSHQPEPEVPARATSLTHQSTKPTLQIRVITPESAYKNHDPRDIPLLRNGQHYPLSTTLSRVRQDIAESLGLTNYKPPLHDKDECNCALALHITKRGIWEKVTCSNHILGQCTFGQVRRPCAQCSEDIGAHPPSRLDVLHCDNFVLIRRDLDCSHVVHGNCIGLAKSNWSCPPTCSTTSNQRKPNSSILVVHSFGLTQTITTAARTKEGIEKALEDHFGHGTRETKAFQFIGGSLAGDEYLNLPVLAICSNKHPTHSKKLDAWFTDIESSVTALPNPVLDLHTSEGPIETSDPNITLGTARLEGLTIDGVLHIFAVHWHSDGQNSRASGKDSLFAAAPYWNLPVSQTDRATCAVLSCLRILSHVTGQEDFEEVEQNEILRQTHLITRFVPAVRSLHILMTGKTLLPGECAALVQSIAFACGDIVPRHLIQNDEKRLLEGCRLLFGSMLHRAKAAKVRTNAVKTAEKMPQSLAYISAFHTVDLKDIITRDPIRDPVQVDFGLVDRTTYNTLMNGGPLGYTPDDRIGKVHLDADNQVFRIATLYGGVSDEVRYSETDALTAAYLESFHEKQNTEVTSYSNDLKYLAMLTEETRLSVISPTKLSSAQPPCLTLDRDGNLAVYTGQAACAPPDKDKSFYRPLLGREENTDVTIVSQKLVPILSQRERDGTIVFDIFSSTFRRKDSQPTEMLMLCVDCSYSMKNVSDFEELREDDTDEDDDSSSDLQTAKKDFVVDQDSNTQMSLDEIRDWIVQHESYEDMLVIVRAVGPKQGGAKASQIVQYLRTLLSRHIAHLTRKALQRKLWGTWEAAGQSSRRKEEKFEQTRAVLASLHLYETAICDFLVFKANDPNFVPESFMWYYGDVIPNKTSTTAESETIDVSELCSIPEEFICPIKSTIFEDPVTTTDGFTFDRRAIERWFRIRKTSPLTGLELTNATLTRNQPMADQIKSWLEGDDIFSSLSIVSRLRTLTRNSSTITFIAPTGTFSRRVPMAATLADLHKLAYRGMRGSYNKFSLHHNGHGLQSSSTTIFQHGIKNSTSITVQSVSNTADEAKAIKKSTASSRDMVLIRVYTGGYQHSKPIFSYWVTRNTTLTTASILFKYWRFLPHQNEDRDAWVSLRDAGDGRLIGHSNDPWKSLDDTFDQLLYEEITEHDILCKSLRDITRAATTPATATDPVGDRKSKYESTHRILRTNLFLYQNIQKSMKRVEKEEKMLSRIGVTKQVFGAFINRLIAYNYNVVLGLVTFGNTATLSQPITEVIENFRTAVDMMTPQGDTALWDALGLAIDHMNEQDVKHPSIRKRILCLSDGADTSSVKTSQDIVRLAFQHNVVIDSCTIGTESNQELRKLSYVTGGYKFKPQTLEEAVTICEVEPVLSLQERPERRRPELRNPGFFIWNQVTYPKADRATVDDFPSRKSHASLGDSFIHISVCSTNKARQDNAVAGTSGNPSSLLRPRRILNEIKDIAARPPHPSYDIYVSESNMSFWKIVMSGPPESAYAGGTFVLYLDMDETYPVTAPKGRFVTSIFHPNINRHGKICHSIFDRNWAVDTSNKHILDTVFGLLLVPEFSDPVNTVVTLNYYWDEVAFRAEVQRQIQKHATTSREDWRKKIEG